jgi:DNA repair protein SbcC/Rad50
VIESVKITNFQSLNNVEIELGKFTVIVGPSSSGKSALTRAIKAVALNALDSDYITRGTKHSAVSIKTEQSTVTIERETGGSSVYQIAKVGSEESRYSKLNRQVPAQITEALGISPGTKEVDSIHFAGQFDTPYLLKEGSSSVARVLGELTNVSTIFSAVREASKRAKAASGIVNLRKKDQQKLLDQVADYSQLAPQAKGLAEVESQLAQCQQLQTHIDRLTSLHSQADSALRKLQTIKEVGSLPDLGSVVETQLKLNRLKSLVRTAAGSRKMVQTATSSIDQASSAIMLAETQLHDTLVEHGTCPTCQQQVS